MNADYLSHNYRKIELEQTSENEADMNAGKTLTLLTAIFLVLGFAAAQPTFATDYTVDGSSACTLADAIKAANRDEAYGNCAAGSGDDTIYLSGDITLSSPLPTVRSNMTINSNDHTIKRVISGNHAFRIFNVESGARLKLLCLQLIDGRNHAMRGGAIRVLDGRVELSDVRMENNWAEFGGGALRVGNGSSASCNMCQFVDNQAPDGGAIWVGDEGTSFVLQNSVVYNNSAERGGGMFIKQGSATISGTSFSNNSANEGPDLLSIDAELTLQPSANINPARTVSR